MAWRWTLLFAAHALAGNAIFQPGGKELWAAPMLLGMATLLLHEFGRSLQAPVLALALIDVLLALHADFQLPSLLPKTDVVWAVAALWVVLLLTRRWLVRLGPDTAPSLAFLFSVLLGAHILFVHHPEAPTGLLVLLVLGLLASATPLTPSQAGGRLGLECANLLLAVPLCLAWFSQSHLRKLGYLGLWELQPLLALAAACLALAWLARMQKNPAPVGPTSLLGLLRQTVAQVPLRYQEGFLLATGALLAVALGFILVGGTPVSPRFLALLSGLWALTSLFWHTLSRNSGERAAWLMEVCAAGLALTLRLLLRQTTAWTDDYDVWVMLAASFCLTALKQRADQNAPQFARSLATAVVVLPAGAIVWALVRHLGVELILMVLALNSLFFTFLGHNRRTSPYNALAVVGFTAFLLTLALRLRLDSVQAYVIPVGLGVLALLQLFGGDLAPAVRNRIRLSALLPMLGSAGWYSVADARYPVAFHLVMLALCLAAMALGSLLRLRLYVLLGFTGLAVDLVSLLVKGLLRLEAAFQMAIIGAILLLLGVLVVVGTAWYKMNQARVTLWLDALRQRLSVWE